jgi:hypothetical protein
MAMAANNGIQLSMLAMSESDKQILKQIYATRVLDDKKFDANSLFIVAKNILKRVTHSVDNVMVIYMFLSLYITSVFFFFRHS